MKSAVISFICIFLLLQFAVEGKQIVFQKYCLNDTHPEVLPGSGSNSSGSVVMNSKSEGGWYLPNLNCTVTLSAQDDYRLLLTFSNISLRNSSMDNLTVVYNGGESESVLAGQQVCSNENCIGLKFESGDSNNITLKFVSANVTVPQNVTGFRGHYTVYDLVNPRTGACPRKNQFLCENMHCIWYNLICDGHNNCGDMSDETKCVIPVRNTVWGIVVIVAAILSVLIFVPLFCYLATYGTRNIVKSVTMTSKPTPLLNAIDCGESSGLLTSSEAANNCWPGTSYDRSYSFSYGSAQNSEYPATEEIKASRSHSVSSKPQQNVL